LKTIVTVFHRDITFRDGNPRPIEIEVDVEKEFTVEQMKKCHNKHLEKRTTLEEQIKDSAREPHEFTPDMLKFFDVYNRKVGWIGCFRIPDRLVWGKPEAEPELANDVDRKPLKLRGQKELQPA